MSLFGIDIRKHIVNESKLHEKEVVSHDFDVEPIKPVENFDLTDKIDDTVSKDVDFDNVNVDDLVKSEVRDDLSVTFTDKRDLEYGS